MPAKLIMVEGIPGSGKTTISRKIYNYLLNKGISTCLFNEGDMHPADLAWHSCVMLDEYEKLLENYPNEKDAIVRQTSIENGYAVIAYTKIDSSNIKLLQLLESYELYDARSSFNVYRDLHQSCWSNFAFIALKSKALNIFECAYFQNHINELIFWRNASDCQIYDYMVSLLDTVKLLNPIIIIYLSQKDVKKTIERIAAERVNEQGEKEWLNRCCNYLRNCPYGKLHNLTTFDDFIRAFEKRKATEMNLLDKLNVESHIINNPNYNWDKVWREVQKIVDQI